MPKNYVFSWQGCVRPLLHLYGYATACIRHTVVLVETARFITRCKKVKAARNSKTKTQTKRKHSCAQRYAHKYEQFLNLCLATGLD